MHPSFSVHDMGDITICDIDDTQILIDDMFFYTNICLLCI